MIKSNHYRAENIGWNSIQILLKKKKKKLCKEDGALLWNLIIYCEPSR